MLEKRVADVMSKKVTTVSQGEILRDIVLKMAHENIGAVVIVEGDKPVGIFTERDLLKRVAAKNVDLGTTQVGEVMTSKLIAVPPSTSLKEVIQKMYTVATRHMLVMENGKLLGIFSIRDLLRHLLA